MPSSVIRSFDYDPALHRLFVRFVSGRLYHYDCVPGRVFEAMRRAPSKGRYFNRMIRDRFPATRDR
jgi:hypothetical protein